MKVQELSVYQKAYEVSLDIHKASMLFPQIEQYNGIADQLRRSTKSICANLVEGFSKQQQSKLEWKRYLTIAIATGDESLLWLDYARDLGYMDIEKYTDKYDRLSEVNRMLVGLRKQVQV